MTSKSRRRQENEEPIDLLPSLQDTAPVQKNDDNEQVTREGMSTTTRKLEDEGRNGDLSVFAQRG